MYLCPVFFTAEKPEAQGESPLFSARRPVHYSKHTCSISIPGFFLCSGCFSCCLPFFLCPVIVKWSVDGKHVYVYQCKKIAKENNTLRLSAQWFGLLCGNICAKCRVPVKSLHACIWIVFPSRKPTHTVCKVPPAWYCSQPCHKIMRVGEKELQPLNFPGSSLIGNTRTSSISGGPHLESHSGSATSQVLIDEAAPAPPGAFKVWVTVGPTQVEIHLRHPSDVNSGSGWTWGGLLGSGSARSCCRAVDVCVHKHKVSCGSTIGGEQICFTCVLMHVSTHISLIYPVYISCWVTAAESCHALFLSFFVPSCLLRHSAYVICTECKELRCHFLWHAHVCRWYLLSALSVKKLLHFFVK